MILTHTGIEGRPQAASRPQPSVPQTSRPARNPLTADRWCQECGFGVKRRTGTGTVYLHPGTHKTLAACPDCGERLKVRETAFAAYHEHQLKAAAWELVVVDEIETGEGEHEHFGHVATHRATGLRLVTGRINVDVTGYDRATLPDYVFTTVDGLPVSLSLRRCARQGRDWFAVYGVEESK